MLTGDNSASQMDRRTVAHSAAPQRRTSAPMIETASGRLARSVTTIGMAIPPRTSEDLRTRVGTGRRTRISRVCVSWLIEVNARGRHSASSLRRPRWRCGQALVRAIGLATAPAAHIFSQVLADKRTHQQRREFTWQRDAQEHNGTGMASQQPPHAVSPLADIPLRATTSSLASAQWSSWKNGLFS